MTRRLVDLSFPIFEGMTAFPVPWHPAVEVTVLGRHDVEGRETRRLVIGTHTGTHCDAPRHFVPDGATIDRLPLDVFVGPARVVDLSHVPPGHAVTVADLEQHVGGDMPERLVLRYDWSRHWGSPRYYLGHPFLSDAAANWLVKRRVRLLAMDTPMPDDPRNGYGSNNDSPVHRILLGGGVVLVEYLCGLDQLASKEVDLIVLPLKIAEGDGSPVRCIAIERPEREPAS